MGEISNSTYISERIKSVRLGLKLDISTVSDKSGINRKTIYRYESGDSLPRNFDTWESLAKGHGMDIGHYLDALFCIKKIQLSDYNELENRVVMLERKLKNCPLTTDSS